MKKLLFTLCFFFLLVTAVFAQTSSKKMYVNIKEVELKNSTGFFGKTVARAKYGDAVYVLEENGKWLKVSLVSNSSVSGWVPAANLTKKKIKDAYSDKASANANELSLAGKGLTEGTGTEFKSDGKNYNAVEKVERIKTQPNELQNFIQTGNLKDGE